MATGAQWDFMQVVAWGRMFATYAETMSIGEAAKKTFNGEMCDVCEVVNEAKQQEKTNVPTSSWKAKLTLVYQSVPSVFLRTPEPEVWSLSDREPLSAQRPVPPTPPPRVT